MPSWIFRRFAVSNAWRSRYPSAKRKSCSGYVSDATACGPDPRVQHASWTLTYPECAVVIGPAHSIDVDGVGQTPGGLAKYFNVDVTPIRILFVVMTVFGGAGLVLYLTMWILVPQSSEPPSSLADDLARVSDSLPSPTVVSPIDGDSHSSNSGAVNAALSLSRHALRFAVLGIGAAASTEPRTETVRQMACWPSIRRRSSNGNSS
jgi:phage shock protein PspC (stress-responsive transcriptional regulator)